MLRREPAKAPSDYCSLVAPRSSNFVVVVVDSDAGSPFSGSKLKDVCTSCGKYVHVMFPLLGKSFN